MSTWLQRPVDLREGEPNILEMLEDLVSNYEVKGLRRPWKTIPFEVDLGHLDSPCLGIVYLRGEYFKAAGIRAYELRVPRGCCAVPATDIKQLRSCAPMHLGFRKLEQL